MTADNAGTQGLVGMCLFAALKDVGLKHAHSKLQGQKSISFVAGNDLSDSQCGAQSGKVSCPLWWSIRPAACGQNPKWLSSVKTWGVPSHCIPYGQPVGERMLRSCSSMRGLAQRQAEMRGTSCPTTGGSQANPSVFQDLCSL